MNIEVENDSVVELPDENTAFMDLPSLEETAQQEPFENLPALDDAHLSSAGLDAVHEVPVKMQAVLGRARMTVAELLQMRPGRVVELDRKVGEPVDIFVNNRLIARGEVVLIDKVLGVTLTEIVREED